MRPRRAWALAWLAAGCVAPETGGGPAPTAPAAEPACTGVTFTDERGQRRLLPRLFANPGVVHTAWESGTLSLCAGWFPAAIVVPGDARLVVTGAGVGVTVLDGSGDLVPLQVGPTASLAVEDLTITGGDSPEDGGGVFAFAEAGARAGAVVLRRVTLEGNAAEGQGGGLDVNGPFDVLLEDVRLEANHAASGGGLFLRGVASAQVIRTTLLGNTASGDGGGARIHASPVVLTDVDFLDNRAVDRGAACRWTPRPS